MQKTNTARVTIMEEAKVADGSRKYEEQKQGDKTEEKEAERVDTKKH